MLSLIILPAVFLGLGVAVGGSAALLSRKVTWLRSSAISLPVVAMLVVALAQLGAFGLEALRYDGACSGWQEQGSHPCTRLEFVLQDWELGLIFSIVPTLAAIGAALIAFSRLAPRSPA